ncbi:MAG TPA: ferritin [bacterium]|jgi:ferritin
MISENMIGALNSQIKHELYSSQLYLAMSAFCDRQNLKGFAHWMRVQADEERGHGLKFFDYLLQLGVPVRLEAVDQPPIDFGTPKQIFVAVLEHERMITSKIHGLYEQALAEKDYRTQVMLQWFVNEQIEEEEQAMEILTKIEQVDERMSSILWIDKELKKRA